MDKYTIAVIIIGFFLPPIMFLWMISEGKGIDKIKNIIRNLKGESNE